ncbi:MAG: hypothetical protein ABR526_10415 [Chthoniobacterales bacterium]
MKKYPNKQSGFFSLRILLAVALVTLSSAFVFVAFAASPTGGTISPGGPNPPVWNGTGLVANGGGEADCTEGQDCDSYKLTISGTPADWAAVAKLVHVQINWTSPSTDYDMFVHKGTLAGPVVASSAGGGNTSEQVDLDPRRSNIGTGDFVVHVVYFAATAADQYKGAATLAVAGPLPAPAPAPISGLAPRYENYTPPAAGPATLGRAAGEPSIGVGLPFAGHPEGHAMFQADLQTLRVTFNGCAKSSWVNDPPATSAQDFDPILFTDRITGRTIVHLLTFAANPVAGESSVSDTDGAPWIPSKGSGIGSGVDHQTVGAGPYRTDLAALPPVVPPPHPTYANAVYYCSQALVDASCARSDDGGINYGPSTITYRDECGGLHGHVKVAPDGTVYLPNKGCGTQQSVVVSEDNGATWAIRKIPASASAGSDPSVGTDAGGKLYVGYADNDTTAAIAVSTDKGKTFSRPLDVGATFGINNVVFPAVVAGDKDRAAFAFLGTPVAGGLQGPRFPGIWHLYIASTYDGGATWSTVDATPNDPVQRGCVWLSGGANICRNMLDFMDVQMDQQGRVVVGYADGCAGGECAQAPSTATGNSYTALATIARQSGGRRLLAKFDTDPSAAATAPGMPFVSAKRNGGVTRLQWSEADNGGSPITRYDISRGTATGAETPLGSVAGSQLGFDDTTVPDPAATYFYKVTAVNALGNSCGDNEVSIKDVGSSIVGTGFKVAADPTGDQTGAPGNADLDIQSLSVAEPTSGANAGKLVFNLKVTDLSVIPNERMWRIVWNSQNVPIPADPTAPKPSQFYLGMTKDAAGAVTYEYGTVATATVGLVLGVPSTTKVGAADSGSFVATGADNGLITIVVSKGKVGNPRPGDLLGAMSVRTYNVVNNQIRSTNAIDSTGNATTNDKTANAATYALFEAAPVPLPTPTPTPQPPQLAQLLNISSRLAVRTGDNVGFAGFIVTGSEAKKVVLRGIGPSLSVNGQPTLQDPVLELFDSNSAPVGANDNWKDTQKTEIEASGLAPTNDRESALVATLNPGLYTVILRGKNSETGIGVVEVYDVNTAALSVLANISSRGFVDTGDKALFGGFIVGPPSSASLNVVVRAIGPSLGKSKVPNPLQDPTLELYDGNGARFASNDNWKDTQQADLEKTGLAPSDDRESAILTTLVPGLYTAIVRGKDQGIGNALVELYNVR